MNDRRLVELLLDYGKIAYGRAYMKICALGVILTYELLKEELETMLTEEKISYVKAR